MNRTYTLINRIMMKKKFLQLATAILAVAFAGCDNKLPPVVNPGDIVVYGTIYTAVMNPGAKSEDNGYQMAEAMVIKDGKYIFVGSKADAQQFISHDTQIIDHTGKGMIMPGMTDGHSHYIMQQALPMFAENSIKFTSEDTYEDVLDKVRAKVNEAKAAGKKLNFIYGEGYNYMFFTKQRDCKDLDAISTEIPMFLASFDQHSCWCNSAAMINAGLIDKDGNVLRSEIEGGVVAKDEKGKLMGVFYERATSLLLTKGLKYMRLTPSQAVVAVGNAQDYLHSVGITNVLCGWSTYFGNDDKTFYQGLAELEESNALKLNYALAYEIEPYFENPLSYVDSAAVFKQQYENYPHILPRYIKLFADGTVEGGTGWLLQPYKPIPDSPVPGAFQGEGMPVWTLDQLTQFVSKANAKGIAIHVHTMGDGAVHNACEAIKAGSNGSIRNALCHLRNVAAEDFVTIKNCNIAVAAAINWHNMNPATLETMKRMLPEYYANKSYPVKSYFDNGILASSATDTPAHDGVNYPFHILEVAITGVGTEGQQPWCPEENASRQQALQALTYNGAWQLGLENERGSIEVGKYADFVIVDRNVLTCPVNQIHTTKVVYTFFEGEQVYPKKKL